MPGALVIQTRSSLWYRQSRLKLESEETKRLAQKKGDELQGLTCDLKKTTQKGQQYPHREDTFN